MGNANNNDKQLYLLIVLFCFVFLCIKQETELRRK